MKGVLMEIKRSSVSAMTKQERETHPKWDWVEPTVWTDKMLAALDKGVKGGKWFSLIDKVWSISNLESAWKKVASNRGSAGVDNVSITHYKRHAKERLNRTSELLKDNLYRPNGVKRVWIDKAGSKDKRPLGIPTVTDRVVQTALRNVIEPIFEKDFAQNSFGFRPHRGCKDALREVDRLLKQGYKHIVDADLKGYFDSIPKDKLMERVEEKIADSRVLDLIKLYLEQEVIETASKWTPETGTPQGAVISPLLANIYLDSLDWLMLYCGFTMIRYADDFVIMCRNREEAELALTKVSEWTEESGLTLHPTKTKIVDANTDPFEFLGYKFKLGNKYPTDKSIKKYKDKIRKFTRRTNAHDLETIIIKISRIQKGWFEYFKHSNKFVFESLDGWTRRRLRSIVKKRDKRRGIATTNKDNIRYPNKIFDKCGFFSLARAHSELCKSLK
jgi:RNA-directed DNA polymerase